MYQLKPVTPRVQKMREKYHSTKPAICTARYRLITKFYMENQQLDGILKRSRNFKYICENLPLRVEEDEVIVGAQTTSYRACALYPENSIRWLIKELEGDCAIRTREVDPYIISEEDRQYILETGDFWLHECLSGKLDDYIPESFIPHAKGNWVTMFTPTDNAPQPVGHFCSNYDRAIRVGFGAIRREALDNIARLDEEGIYGTSIEQYNFYRAIVDVCDGMITLAKRYSALVADMAARETRPARKAELERMAAVLDNVMEKPCRSFHEAVQCMFLYHMCMCLDACMHGISFGRVDQYLGDFYEADLAAGRITPEYAQELIDLLYLKVAEMNKPWSEAATRSNPGYTSGMLMTLGGVKPDGSDATNAVTYMMLQASGRLVLHDPPQSLRIHKGTPAALWEAAIETTKIAGGVPTFENDDVIIPSLMDRGHSLESARNYCLIGCVEPAGTGNEWPACGGVGVSSYWNMENAFMLAINNGSNPLYLQKDPDTAPTGVETGYLYEMETFDDVLAAVEKQMDLFVRWHANMINAFEYVARDVLPLPVVSSTMTGCMESGKDVMYGGAEYNSTGISGIAIGNIVDSLAVVKYMCFDEKKCTTRELYDALMANWEGYEELHQYILNCAPHYGNDNDYADQFATYITDRFAAHVKRASGPRGNHFAPGLYPVTTNVTFGYVTPASPDGRESGTPLSDGISPVQQMDKNGPLSILNSCAKIDHRKFSNGTLLNMKFHPSCFTNPDSLVKLRMLMETYFAKGGMELQINVVSAETLRAAQKEPDKYQNLVVRVAGFSAYFVELNVDAQNDLIRRTELTM